LATSVPRHGKQLLTGGRWAGVKPDPRQGPKLRGDRSQRSGVCVAHRNRPTPQWPQHCGCGHAEAAAPSVAWASCEVAIFEDIQLTNERLVSQRSHSPAWGSGYEPRPLTVKGARSRRPGAPSEKRLYWIGFPVKRSRPCQNDERPPQSVHRGRADQLEGTDTARSTGF
jgi:hypothetical protein